MSKFAQLANECLHSHPKKRPTMAQVVVGLESILALHEKTNKTLLPMDTKIFGIKVPAFGIPSSNENSVVGSSSKSLESYLYTVGGENRILRRFDFKTVNIATEKFSESNEISRDVFCGPMHKGKLENGQDITVVGPYPHECYDCCMNQVSILVKVEHPNLARLSGWCIERSNMYLIYDIPHNYATLEHVLHDHNRAPLDWDERYKILLSLPS
ncbi:cysteine-rich receptor-like protein kinase 11 [Bidens hawaiensis]|uniref:cysteine-rich receptor-like protein kinase 11 n=1 Tax=Bidens hawaiensis TaxID=980011 RepID=UPI00404AB2AB